MLRRRRVLVFVSLVLALEEMASFAVSIQSRVAPVVCPEGLCHMVDGTSDCACNQGAARCCAKLAGADGLREAREEAAALPWLDVVEEGVSIESNGLAELSPTEK